MADGGNGKIEVVLSMLDKATAPLRAFNKRVEAMQEPFRNLNNKIATFGKEAGLGKLSGAAGGVASAFGGVASEVASLATKIAAGVGIAGGALFGLVKMTADVADGFDEMSTKAGVSAAFFQKAAYAASFASVEQGALANAMGKMNANIVAASTGGKEMQTWFRRAGISAAELRKLKPEQVFERVIAKVKELPKDSAKAGALMKAIFGKSGGDLLPMVESFQEMSKEAEDLGLILSDKTIKAGADFNDSFDKTMKVIKGVGMMIGGMLMPYFKEATDALTAFVIQNRALIQEKVAEWIERARAAWPEFKQGVLDALAGIREFVSGVAGFVEFIGGIGNALKLAAVLIAGPLILALGQLAIAFYSLGVAIMTTPIGWFMAAVALLAGAAYLIYDNWDAIAAFFASLWETIKSSMATAIQFLLDLWLNFTPLGLIIKNWSAIEEWFSGMWDRIKGKFLEGIESIKTMLSNLNPMALAGKAWDWATGAPEGATTAPGAPGRGAVPSVPSALSSPAGAASMRLGPPAGVAPLAAAAVSSGQNSTQTNNAKVEVDFKNLPRGVSVTPDSSNKAPVDLSMGYANQTF